MYVITLITRHLFMLWRNLVILHVTYGYYMISCRL